MSAKILIDINDLHKYKCKDPIPFSCEYCNKTFYRTKGNVQRWIKGTKAITCCSKKCLNKKQCTYKTLKCTQCNNPVTRQLSDLRNTSFCTHSCSAKYWNVHRKWSKNTNRSKLERWLESQLTILYPNLEIHYNKNTTINAELDIYIPSLKLAFELNGIFHYEPIFGEEKLKIKQNNDDRKYQACLENNIELCIIDTTSQKNFREKTGRKFLDIITNILNKKGSLYPD